MPPWRVKLRKVVFRNSLLKMVGEHSLEIGLTVWGLVAGIGMVTGTTPQSSSLRVLPDGLEQLWAILMAIAAVTVIIGLAMRRLATIASGMHLFATILLSYAVAIVNASGWTRGGVVATLLGTFGVVSLLRGLWLKEQETALIKEIARTKRKDA